jgi:formamidopyrimidine-DNA glycosylase
MPELPEVESLRLGLVSRIVGSKIKKVIVKKAKIVSGRGAVRVSDDQKAEDFEKNLIDRKIISIKRKAKNLIIELDDHAIILVHLKMTGQLVFQPFESGEKTVIGGHPIQESETNLPNKHTYIIFELDNGTLFYNDVRQFGYVLYYKNMKALEEDKHFSNLGMEPLSDEFDLQKFREGLKASSSPIKIVLLNQAIVVGCGNIYADEACFASGILPIRPAFSLSKEETKKLFIEIKRILTLAVAQGGSSIANYLLADGSRGNYARYHLVYGRKGKQCLVCESFLKDSKMSGRTTVFCPRCQK